MTNKPSPSVKRRSLADLATTQPTADVSAGSGEAVPASRAAKYPSVTVYLPTRAIRLIKQIGLDENRRISDILAEAVDQYLQRRGHKSLSELQ